jgi:hypothetical protein
MRYFDLDYKMKPQERALNRQIARQAELLRFQEQVRKTPYSEIVGYLKNLSNSISAAVISEQEIIVFTNNLKKIFKIAQEKINQTTSQFLSEEIKETIAEISNLIKSCKNNLKNYSLIINNEKMKKATSSICSTTLANSTSAPVDKWLTLPKDLLHKSFNLLTVRERLALRSCSTKLKPIIDLSKVSEEYIFISNKLIILSRLPKPHSLTIGMLIQAITQTCERNMLFWQCLGSSKNVEAKLIELLTVDQSHELNNNPEGWASMCLVM